MSDAVGPPHSRNPQVNGSPAAQVRRRATGRGVPADANQWVASEPRSPLPPVDRANQPARASVRIVASRAPVMQRDGSASAFFQRQQMRHGQGGAGLLGGAGSVAGGEAHVLDEGQRRQLRQ